MKIKLIPRTDHDSRIILHLFSRNGLTYFFQEFIFDSSIYAFFYVDSTGDYKHLYGDKGRGARTDWEFREVFIEIIKELVLRKIISIEGNVDEVMISYSVDVERNVYLMQHLKKFLKEI